MQEATEFNLTFNATRYTVNNMIRSFKYRYRR